MYQMLTREMKFVVCLKSIMAAGGCKKNITKNIFLERGYKYMKKVFVGFHSINITVINITLKIKYICIMVY